VADARDPKDVRRIEELEAELAKAHREIAELKRIVAELLERERKKKRQAAPFARAKGKTDKKKAGRPVGHVGAWKGRPDHVDESVEARLKGCPCCGGPVVNVEELLQYVVDLPEVRAHVLRILTERAWCPGCRKRVRSTHPRQVSKAGGSAAVAVGPRAVAFANELKHQQGVPYRDIASLFARYLGLRVTHGALAQLSVRLADKAMPDYLGLVHTVQMSALVHTDDTGWRIARLCAWLWVFTTADVTVYIIDFRRGADVVLEVLGKDYAGTLVSDGLPALNALDAHGYKRAQCNSHIISRCSEMEAEQTRGAVRYPREVKALLKDALEIGRRRHEVPAAVYQEAVTEVREALAALAAKNVTHPENLRLAKHLFKHKDSLLRFLADENVPPTNNLAERELRGAVVTRKIGGCNRSETHAHAHAVISSLAQTAHRRGETLTPHVTRWMQPATAGPPR
jgi:transposase